MSADKEPAGQRQRQRQGDVITLENARGAAVLDVTEEKHIWLTGRP
jgi:hypothetical protein